MRHVPQFLRVLGKSDTQGGLAALVALQQELQTQGGFPTAGMTFDQINPISGKSPAQYVVETLDSRRSAIGHKRIESGWSAFGPASHTCSSCTAAAMDTARPVQKISCETRDLKLESLRPTP
jgi:hypothetical protein